MKAYICLIGESASFEEIFKFDFKFDLNTLEGFN